MRLMFLAVIAAMVGWAQPAAAQTDPLGAALQGFFAPLNAVLQPTPAAVVRVPRSTRHRANRRHATRSAIRHGAAEPAVRAAARAAGVPEEAAVHMASIESGNSCSTGGHYAGPLQISPATARSMGFRGSARELNGCGAGLTYGMRHLAACWQATHSIGGMIHCHQGGIATVLGRSAARIRGAFHRHWHFARR